LNIARNLWNIDTPLTQGHRDFTQTTETKRRHLLEIRDRDLLVVQDLENKLGVAERWVAGSPEWHDASTKVALRRYQRCIDSLEGLVVARMFELTKVNMSQTGATLAIFSGYLTKTTIISRLQPTKAYRQGPTVSFQGHSHCSRAIQCSCTCCISTTSAAHLGGHRRVCLPFRF
jgi:hypothetical protein